MMTDKQESPLTRCASATARRASILSPAGERRCVLNIAKFQIHLDSLLRLIFMHQWKEKLKICNSRNQELIVFTL
jgi:hypothetical protein